MTNEPVIPMGVSGDALDLLIYGRSNTAHGKQVCVHRGSATHAVVPRKWLDNMVPLGTLPFAVVGLKELEKEGSRLLQVLLLNPEDPFGLDYHSPTQLPLIELSLAIEIAQLRPYACDPRLRTRLLLGTEPGRADWFPAWRWEHWLQNGCDREARRASIYMWSIREVPTGANLRTDRHGMPMYVVEGWGGAAEEAQHKKG